MSFTCELRRRGMRTTFAALLTLASLAPAFARAQSKLPLSASVTQNEGLMKHLYAFALPPGRQQFLGLTGTVSFTTSLNAFGEALISVNYLQGPNCAAVNNTAYASYSAPGFPVLTHLASFILKNPRAGTLTQQAAIHLPHGVPITNCIVVVLDGGGAWGPAHGNGYTVTMSSALSLAYAPIAPGGTATAVAFGLGGELDFGPDKMPSGSGHASILRLNPAAYAAYAVDAVFGSVSASAFDGSSGEAVPTGYWGARIETAYYASAACDALFPVSGTFAGPLRVFQVPISTAALPAGGRSIAVQSLAGTGIQSRQTSYFLPTAPLTLQPGDCLLTLFRVSANGVIDLEDQSTAMLRPLRG